MRSNAKDLGPLSFQWESTFEGILLYKEKGDQIFKKNYTFTERWCRLKGNLLVICRTGDRRCTEIHGLVILEGFQITHSEEKEVSHAFKIVFDAEDSPIVFAARSESERELWCRHLSRAGLMNLVLRMDSLREEVKRRTGRDPLENSGLPDDEDVQDYEGSEDANGMELTFSCKNLSMYNSELKPNSCILLAIKTTPQSEWVQISRTEIIENNTNPVFLKTLFVKEDRYTISSQVRLNLIDFRDIRSMTMRVVAQAFFTMEDVHNNSCLNLNFKEVSGSSQQTGTVTIKAKMRHSDSSSNCNQSDVYSSYYRSHCDNILTKSYRFPSQLNEDLKVVEYMGEPFTTIDFPIEYLKQVIHEEHLLFDSLSRFASSQPNLERLRTDRLIGLKGNIESYENAVRFLSDFTGPRFKASRDRNHTRLEFLPVNLHVNRIATLNEENNLVLFHDVVTAGVFAAHTLRFKTGGLGRMATSFSDCLSDYATCTQALRLIRQGLHLGQEVQADLTSLCSRLQPGQETLEAEKIEKKIKSLKSLYMDQYVSDLMDMSSVHASHDTLHGLLINPPKSGSRSTWMASVHSQVEDLQRGVEALWGQAAEILWPKVLEGLAPMEATYHTFQYRTHICLCQALTATVTGIINAMCGWSVTEWRQMAVCGVPLHFEGLLSTYHDEAGMLEDMSYVIDLLQNIRIMVRPGTKTTVKLSTISEIQLTCLESVWQNMPEEIRSRGRLKLHLHPYFFNVGVNEQQTIADTLGKTIIQDNINNKAYTSLKAYFDRYTKWYGAPRKTYSDMEVYDALASIRYDLDHEGRNKPVSVLRSVAEVSWTLNAVRFTSCKSAKDRTAMSLTLEQVRWLKYCVGMHTEYFDAALECIRRTGLRLENTLKNTGSRKYAFSRIQLLSFPKYYRPPVGTYGVGQT